MRRALLATVIGCLACAGVAQALTLHVQRRLSVRGDVHLRFSAPALANGGYYYAVVVLRPYKRYTRSSPPPCSTSSDMQRADYGYPQATGLVALTLTPSRSRTGHWCRGASYEGAVYAVPHSPPCAGAYPCESEPYTPPSPCWHVGGQVVCGVVVLRRSWSYPEPLPRPLWSGTTMVARFSLRFPTR